MVCSFPAVPESLHFESLDLAYLGLASFGFEHWETAGFATASLAAQDSVVLDFAAQDKVVDSAMEQFAVQDKAVDSAMEQFAAQDKAVDSAMGQFVAQGKVAPEMAVGFALEHLAVPDFAALGMAAVLDFAVLGMAAVPARKVSAVLDLGVLPARKGLAVLMQNRCCRCFFLFLVEVPGDYLCYLCYLRREKFPYLIRYLFVRSFNFLHT